MDKLKRGSRKLVIGIGGGLILAIGIVAIPYPGPGWAIVFVGLAILATEFDWAKSVLDYAKKRYDDWQAWIKRQNVWMRLLFLAVTTFVVVLTLWLLNAYGYMNDFLKLGWDWIRSPLPWFY